MAKPKQQTFNVTTKLIIEIGFEIKAENMQEAVTQAEALSVTDIVDFSLNGWDHNDSEKPVITGLFRS